VRAVVAVLVLLVAARGHAQDASAEDVRAALASQHGEPDVREVVQAVVRHSGIDPARADGAMERARLSGLLPMVRAGLRQGTGYDFLTRQSDTSGTSSLTGSQDLAFIGQLTFRLDRLLYAADERSLLRESRAAAERRLELISEVVRLYFERRRMLVEIALTGETDVEREARIAEIDALFAVLSDGEIVMPTLQRTPEPE
jgi:outer membrane protein TolC